MESACERESNRFFSAESETEAPKTQQIPKHIHLCVKILHKMEDKKAQWRRHSVHFLN